MKKNLFDLDVQVNKTTVSSVQPNVTSIVWCTSGCGTGQTAANCVPTGGKCFSNIGTLC
ncbi:gallidermin/nisin family lantibiotic [Paenibacillus sp. FSL H7-0350]|uniref:gallidermin/nisin family lantibiotic n=1 Tax=Paenibacillus sp. FSL H7-0350 TaxID=2975345 RepID=UPI0031586C44